MESLLPQLGLGDDESLAEVGKTEDTRRGGCASPSSTRSRRRQRWPRRAAHRAADAAPAAKDTAMVQLAAEAAEKRSAWPLPAPRIIGSQV